MGMGKLHKDFQSTVSVEKEHVDAQAGAPEDPDHLTSLPVGGFSQNGIIIKLGMSNIVELQKVLIFNMFTPAFPSIFIHVHLVGG